MGNAGKIINIKHCIYLLPIYLFYQNFNPTVHLCLLIEARREIIKWLMSAWTNKYITRCMTHDQTGCDMVTVWEFKTNSPVGRGLGWTSALWHHHKKAERKKTLMSYLMYTNPKKIIKETVKSHKLFKLSTQIVLEELRTSHTHRNMHTSSVLKVIL